MYSEFDEISFFSATTNSQLVSPDQNSSKPIRQSQSELLLLRPTSEFLGGVEIPAREDRGDKKEAEIEEEPREGEGDPILVANEDGVEENELKASSVKEGDDDDGYHTPTSPRHRIPAVRRCPPAPRKIRPKWATRRRAGDQEFCRIIRRRLGLSDDVELIFYRPVPDYPVPTTIKKARGGEVLFPILDDPAPTSIKKTRRGYYVV